MSSMYSLGKGHGPSLQKTWMHFIQVCFVPSLVEIGIMVLKRIFKSFVNVFFAISKLSPLGEGCSKLSWNWPHVSEKMKMWKDYKGTDNGQKFV